MSKARLAGDEVHNFVHALKCLLFANFEVFVERIDDTVLFFCSGWPGFLNPVDVHNTTGLEIDNRALMPVIELPDDVAPSETTGTGSCLDVDVIPDFGVSGMRLHSYACRRLIPVKRPELLEGVLRVFRRRCTKKSEAELQLSEDVAERAVL